jgi:putative aldouronate transport system permease protein
MITKKRLKKELPLHLMILPGLILILIFSYGPMLGVVIAFKKYNPAIGMLKSPWIGLDNFRYIFSLSDTPRVIRNTLHIASLKIVTGLFFPIIIALLLNEIKRTWFKRIIQTSIYLPHFISWVILGGIFFDILSLDGIVNSFLNMLNIEAKFFLGDNKIFPLTLVGTDLWKNFGYSTIVYLAAITSIDQNLYEAAIIDGAGRWRQTLHITLPGMAHIIVLVATLRLGSILDAGFQQVLILTNSGTNTLVMKNGDIIDTFVYRLGIVNAQFGVAAAAGLFKSGVSLLLVSISYYLAYKLVDYRIF